VGGDRRSISVTGEAHRALQELAKQRNRSMSSIVEDWIRGMTGLAPAGHRAVPDLRVEVRVLEDTKQRIEERIEQRRAAIRAALDQRTAEIKIRNREEAERRAEANPCRDPKCHRTALHEAHK